MTSHAVMAAVLLSPLAIGAQTYAEHEHAKHVQERHDARHHTKAKIVGGSAAGGAVVGALAGGPKGAVVGAGVGAGAGLVANHVRKSHDIHKRERREDERSY
jgi:outer membrane lipoprotein SlyB